MPELQVTDFGLSRLYSNDVTKTNSNVGINPRWLAPEVSCHMLLRQVCGQQAPADVLTLQVISSQQHSTAADVFR